LENFKQASHVQGAEGRLRREKRLHDLSVPHAKHSEPQGEAKEKGGTDGESSRGGVVTSSTT